ncbi:MAG: hypothetical protein ACYCZF_09500 [Anaerolineae bacterium]
MAKDNEIDPLHQAIKSYEDLITADEKLIINTIGKHREAIYDPYEEDIANLDNILKGEMKVEDLCNPSAVQLLLQERKLDILRLAKNISQFEIATNRLTTQEAEIANLRVSLAKAESERTQKSKFILVEIPASIISGFAINTLVIDSHNLTGWFLLLVSIAIVLLIRFEDIFKARKDQNA